MKKTNFRVTAVLLTAFLISGCCSNYKTYAKSIAADLEALKPTYTSYVMKDERLSDADREARLSVLKEMEEKTAIAVKDSE